MTGTLYPMHIHMFRAYDYAKVCLGKDQHVEDWASQSDIRALLSFPTDRYNAGTDRTPQNKGQQKVKVASLHTENASLTFRCFSQVNLKPYCEEETFEDMALHSMRPHRNEAQSKSEPSLCSENQLIHQRTIATVLIHYTVDHYVVNKWKLRTLE